MLRAGWWPASLKRPRTGFTIRTLKFFQTLSMFSKTNGYDFWRTIVQMTDGTGIENLPVSSTHLPIQCSSMRPLRLTLSFQHRYEELMIAIRCFRTLRMAKRGGRGQWPEGITGTKEGELGLDCPACPHEGKNLEDDWEDVPPDKKSVLSIHSNHFTAYPARTGGYTPNSSPSMRTSS